jgi:hypothetical protein
VTTSRGRAADLLTHYLRTAFEGAGLKWDSDNSYEVDQLVDALHEMVVDEIQEHAENAPHLYPDGSAR